MALYVCGFELAVFGEGVEEDGVGVEGVGGGVVFENPSGEF